MSTKRNPQILVELQEWMGSDAAIANAGWSSTYDKARREEKYDDPEKVRFLIEKRLFGQEDVHNVPIESVIFRFWIRHPIFIDRQHMTHRIQSANGLSGRYRTLPSDYFELPEDVMDILGKVDTMPNAFPTPQAPNTTWDTVSAYYESCETAVNNYKRTIEKMKAAEKAGVISNEEFRRARELVRGQMPLANMTERTTIMNLGSFANYQRKRNSSHAQAEIKQVAEMMLEQVEEANICPIAIACLKSRGWKM